MTMTNLGKLFAPFADDDAVAITDLSAGDGAADVGYDEFDRRCDAVARGLTGAGIGRGDRVGILALNCGAYLEVLFGAMRAGAVPVPLNLKLPDAALETIADDAGIRLLFADAGNAGRSRAVDREVVFGSEEDLALRDPGPFEALDMAADDVALQPYTSGSTGRPKGVLLSHAGQLWCAPTMARARNLDRSNRVMVAAPLYHKNALVQVKLALATGGRMVLLDRFDAQRYLQAIADYGCSMMSGVPTMFWLLLREEELLDRLAFPALQTISMGSAPASEALLKALKARFPGVAVVSNYGITEGGPVMFGPHPDGLPRPAGAIGYPLPGTEAALRDGPSTDEGTLWVRNPGVMLGYHNLPEATAARFDDGWFDTGDICRRDGNGWFYFVGRADDMFVCGGENIYPADVEKRLESHPAVRQAVVLPFADELKGQLPFAFVVPAAGAAVDEAALKAHALANGPAYAHPRRVLFLDALPLTGTNKIDTRALRALVAEGAAPGASDGVR